MAPWFHAPQAKHLSGQRLGEIEEALRGYTGSHLWPKRSDAGLQEMELEMRGYTSTHLWQKNTHLWQKRLIEKPSDGSGLTLEAWSQGFMVGSLLIMAAITLANMRRGVLLHKLILLELILGCFHGTFIFTNPPVYGIYLSVTAIFLNMSWSIHNVISWIKIRPFLSRNWSLVFIGTVILAQPYWVVEIYANFTYFNNINSLFVTTRPYEAIFRDPWWICATVVLFYTIINTYSLSLFAVIRISPRFGVLLAAMILSIIFIIVDIISVTSVLKNALPDGLNPFWKLAFVYKCLVDSIILDDFKVALDKLMSFKLRREHSRVSNTMNATQASGSDLRPWPTIKTLKDVESGYDDEGRSCGTPGTEDPLGEDAGERQRADERGSEASVTFQQMLGRGNAEPQARTGAPQSWEDLELPEFTTGSKKSRL